MRVVAGIARGRRLVAPKGDGTRPTSDFVREAVFNSLASHVDLHDDGTNVLDLFAGTGALGIEALSRGATHATFVEADRHALTAIRTNLDACQFSSHATVVSGDATKVTLPTGLAVAFADPPYAFADTAWHDLLTRIDAGLVVVESDREIDVGDAWRVLRTKRYGTTVVTLAATARSSF